MNESPPLGDERLGGPSRPPLGAELLPPVEEPSARFIIQLFVVPALIVLAIVGVWLSFTWLVRSTTISPDKLIEGIDKGPSVARWQRASELADMLHNKRYANLKRDHEAAQHLAQILDREIDDSKDGRDGQQSATLRYFLARALGEFEVPEGTDTLLKAAETKRTADDELVRHGAIEAIAVRAFDLQQLDPPEQLSFPELEPALIRLSGDEDANIRSVATYALGQLGTPDSIKRLESLVNDPDPDTRYNAAIALAHRGNTKSMETLAEMLDVSELTKAAPKIEDDAKTDDNDTNMKAAVIVASALDASHALARQNPQADLSVVTEAIQRFSKTDPQKLKDAHIPTRIVSDAEHLLNVLKKE
jgi:HEAT repeat protein